MAARLRVDTHLHALRHYTATELLAAGVDVRTVAGRLGHAGGGTTTLRFYSAWRYEADQRAARNLGMSMPDRPGQEAPKLPSIDPVAPYQRLAVELRDQVLAGVFVPGLPLPSMKRLADDRGVAISTARKAVNLLGEWGLVDLSPGRPTVVRKLQGREVPEIADAAPNSSSTIDAGGNAQEWLVLEIRRLGRTVARVDAQASPEDGDELRRLLTDAVKRDGQPASAIGEYEMVVRCAGESEPLRTFVTTTSG